MIGHLFKDCVYARDFWHKICVPLSLVNSFNNDVNIWLRENCQSKVSHSSSIPWNYVFPFAIQDLWKQRIRVVFDNTTLNPNLYGPCINQALEYYFNVRKAKNQRNIVIILIRWNKPPSGWCKLNTDGASLGNPGKGQRRRAYKGQCG